MEKKYHQQQKNNVIFLRKNQTSLNSVKTLLTESFYMLLNWIDVNFFSSATKQMKNFDEKFNHFNTHKSEFFKIKAFSLIVIFIFMINEQGHAQVANYVFSESAGTYTALTGTTNATAGNWDDNVTAAIPIGFTFNYNGVNYTNCYISSNGFITFGAAPAGNNYTPISSVAGYAGAISGFGVDLRDGGNFRSIVYNSVGAAGNRIFSVQWREARRDAQSGNFDFQIQLHESSNVIKVVYGAFNLNNNQDVFVQVGLRGANNTDYNNRRKTTDGNTWDGNTIAGTVNNHNCVTDQNTEPGNGRTFIWTPRPTISSFGVANGCPGGNITINGTNLIGATPAGITIGGTPVTSIVSNNGTQIVAVIGNGTTGTVSVTTPGGTATSAGTFTVNPVPTITVQPIASPLSYCEGQGNGTISVTAIGATTYQWRRNGINLANNATYANVDSATLSITNPALSESGNFDVIIGNGTCSVISNPVAVTTNPIPVINTQPSPTSVCTSGSTTFTVATTNATSWQWRRNGVNLTNTPPYTGVTTATLTITNPTLVADADYDVVLNNTTCPVTSSIAHLTVNQAPTITTQPSNPTAVCSGDGSTRTISVIDTGGITYQWRLNGTPLTNSGPYSGVDTPTLTITNAITGEGGNFDVIIDNSICTTTSNIATLVVNPVAAITVQPTTPAPVCSGNGIATISVTATGATTYKWRRNGVNVNDSAIYGGTTTATLTITNPTVANSGTFDVVINGGACQTISIGVDLTVNPLPVITVQPVNTTICTVGTGSFNVSATGNGLTYQWRRGAVNLTDNATFSGTNSDILSITNPTAGDAGNNYNVVVTNTEGCSVTSINRTLTVNTTPIITTQPTTPAAVCESQGTRTITITATGVTTYRWRKNGVLLNNGAPYGGVTTATLTITNPTMAADDDYDVILNATTCPVISNTVHLTVNPVPVITIEPVSTSICTNGSGSFSVTATGTGLTYQWRRGAVNVTDNAIFSGSNTSTLTITNPTAGEAGNNYNVIVTNSLGCTDTSLNRTLTVTQAVTAIAGTPVPANNATGICYTSYNALTLLNWGNVANATSYDVYFGAGSLPGAPVANVTVSDYTLPGPLAPNTTYFWQIIPQNTCGITSGTPVTWSFTTNALPCYCPSLSSSSSRYISSYSTSGGIVDAPINNTGFSAGGFGNYTANAPAQQIPGGGLNVKIVMNGGTLYVKGWVDWNNDGDFADANETIYTANVLFLATTFGFIIPPATVPGNYRLRLKVSDDNNTFDSCTSPLNRGETEDYTITVIPDCAAKIVSAPTVERCDQGPVTLSVTGSASATSYNWYTTQTGGVPIPGETSASYTTPSLNSTTTYYVTASDGSCESLVRKPIVAKIKTVPVVTFTPSAPVFCGENDVIQVSVAAGDETIDLFSENFNSGSLGGFTYTNIAGGNANNRWQQVVSVYKPTATAAWFPAISSGELGDGVAYSTSDFNGNNSNLALQTTNPINTNGFTSLTLSFRQYFSFYGNGDSANIEVSTNNGVTWLAPTLISYTSSQGEPGKFSTVSLNLNAYINVTNLKFRFRYRANWCDGWAIDDIVLTGTKPLASSFTWTGATIDAYTDAALTIPYTNQAVNTVYIKPSASQMEVASWSFTANVALSNGCTIAKPLTVTNNTKTWQGLTTDWNDPNNWKPIGVPTKDNCLTIPSPSIISGTNYIALGKNITVKPTGSVEITPSNSLTISDWINTEAGGEIMVRDDAGLVQENDAAVNTGNAKVEKTTAPMYRFDYTYWNSPVTASSNYTLGMLSPNTLADKYWSYNPQVWTTNGHWKLENASTVMTPTKGYIVRAPQTFSSNPAVKTPYTGTFIGVPNNGIINMPLYISTNPTAISANEQRLNLIGNPYPSAIDITKFLNDNSAVVDGTAYVWTHVTPLSTGNADPFYTDYVYNYSANDYITINQAGAINNIPSGYGQTPTKYIASGQSFFVKAKANNVNAFMNNSMRTAGSNNVFYRTANENNPTAELEKHRLWLNLNKMNGTGFSQMMLAYVQGATEDYDNGFDSEALNAATVSMHTFVSDKKLSIQSKPLPFNADEVIPLGYKTNSAGNYAIGIDHFDSLFENQDVYLEDTVLNIIHNLKLGHYIFATASGEFNNRFKLLFTNTTLSNPDLTHIENYVLVYTSDKLNVKSLLEPIKEIIVFDLLGKQIANPKKINVTHFIFEKLSPKQSTLIVKITLTDGTVITKKVIH